MRTVLTGFGPFGSVIDNPSARVVERLAGSGVADHALQTRVLPVSYRHVERELPALLESGDFDAVVLLGVAGRSTAVRLERYGRNVLAGKQDCEGFVSAGERILPNGPDLLETAVALDEMLGAVQEAGVPAVVSDDAGTYLCNYAYYLALHTLREPGRSAPCLFVHLPPDEHTFSHPTENPMPLESQLNAVSAVLSHLSSLR